MGEIEDITKKTIILAPSEVRDKIVKTKLLHIIKVYEQGITIKELVKLSGFNETTVRRYVDELLYEREIYAETIGASVKLYPNHRLVHPRHISEFKIGNKTYEVATITNKEGEFFRIAEIDYSSGIRRIQGSILVDKSQLYSFFDNLMRIYDQLQKGDRDG